MSLKSEKLAQRLEEIQKFVAERTTQAATYATVAQELANIADSLESGKLTVQVVSKYPVLAQALQKFFNSCDTLAEFYQFKIASLPHNLQLAKPNLPAALIRQNSGISQTRHKPLHHQLSTTQTTVIGRHPHCHILLNDNLTLISGFHAEIQPISNPDANNPNPRWQICDRSSNGTYINGIRLQGCQTLQTGDRITLTAPSFSASSPEFIFESQFHATVNHQEDDNQLTNCDVLCLVVNPSQTLAIEEKQLIGKAVKSQVAKLFLVVDVSTPNLQTSQLIETNLVAMEAWLKSQNLDEIIETATLLLKPFYPSNNQAIAVASSSQPEFDQFIQSFKTLTEQKTEDVLLKRTTTQILSQIARIESIFNAQEEALLAEIQRLQENLQEIGRNELKEQTKKALKQAGDDRDKFFKQVKFELHQSKATLLDVFSKKSIIYKIQLFTDHLQPLVIRQRDHKIIQLRAKSSQGSSDTNSSLTHLCYSLLSEWATKEWEQISNFYGEGGLSGMFQRTYATLNFTPSLNLPNSLFQPSQNIDIYRDLKASSVEVPCEDRYRSISPVEYIVKLIRTQTMVWLPLSGICVTFLSLLGVNQLGNNKQAIQAVSKSVLLWLKSIPWLLPIILTGTLFYTFTSIVHAVQTESQIRIEEAAEKLKKVVCSYYQSLAKTLVEKIVQNFLIALDEEEQRLKVAIESAGEKFVVYIAEVEKSELLLKNDIEKYKIQQKSLEKEKADLQKLKRF